MDFEAISELLERVAALQEEQGTFLERVKKLNEKADTITEVVYNKIMSDYRHKLDQLNAELYPLYDQLKLKRSELTAAIDEIEEALNEYKIEKEEIQVRCDLGEFGQKEADKMVGDLEKANEDKFERLNELREYRDKVVDALTAEVVENGASHEVSSADLSSSESAGTGTEPEIPLAPEDELTPEPMEELSVEESATATVPGDVPLPPPPPVDETDKTVLDMGAELEQGSTVLMRTPTLTVQSGDMAGTEYRLKMGVTNIGSGPENDIVVNHPSVAEQHAQVTFGPDGFTIFDYNTPTGITVNGRKITEHLLQDGDTVQIGDIQFVFQS